MNYDVLKIWTIVSLSVLIKCLLITKKVCSPRHTRYRYSADRLQKYAQREEGVRGEERELLSLNPLKSGT